MPKYLSGRQKLRASNRLTEDRYQYLGLDQAEPNLADPLTSPGVPSGTQYQLVAVAGYDGRRYWVPVGGAVIPGAITVFDEGTPVSSASSITQMNFVGAAVTAQVSVQSPSGHPGIAATVTVVPVTVGDSPPNTPNPNNGELWWESDTGDLYVYYNDGDSAQWVMANSGGRGLTGDKGEIGPKGQKGQKGELGNTGSQGDKGEKGAPSTVPGDKGDKGEKGIGQKGEPSTVKGDKGQKGEIGPAGNDGNDGDKGQKGDSGSGGGGASVTISDTAPGSASNGDLWWESDTFDLHVYYQDGTSNQWVSITQSGALKGEKGGVGPQGQKGEIGVGQKGQKGDIGPAGGTGGTGSPGDKGQKGASGVGQKGEPGSVAAKGEKGEPGPGSGTPDKISEGNTEAEVVDTGTDGHFKVKTEGTERLRIGSSGISTFYGNVRLPDNVELQFGNDGATGNGDLRILSNGSEQLIWDNGSGGLVLQTASSPIELRAIDQHGAGNNEIMLKANVGGSIDLYEDGAKRFETTSDGVKITGGLQDKDGQLGTSGQVLSSTGTELNWVAATAGDKGQKGDTGVKGQTGATGSQTFTVTNSGASAYQIDGANNPTLTLVRGFTYTFNVNASGHPFYIKTSASTGTGNQYTTGVTNNGVQVGTLTFVVPSNAPATLYYICQYHGSMVGTINTVENGEKGQKGDTGAQGSPGGLLQTNSSQSNSTSGSTSISTSYTEIFNLSIIPSSTNSKIAVLSSMVFDIANTSGNLYADPSGLHKLTRTIAGTETVLVEGTCISQRDNVNATKYQRGASSITYLDSPSTTNTVTYKLFAKRGSNANSGSVSQSNIILMETE